MIAYSQPTTWRLSAVDKETGEMRELVVRFQGIINDKNLPPMTKIP